MQTYTLVVVVLAVIGAHVVSSGKTNHDVDCSKGGGFSCHTCLGRDYGNCNTGQTCCKTACFKMIDDKHSLIAKGCWSKDVDPITRKPDHESARTFTTTVELPWATDSDDTTITGLAYFCNGKDGGDYCNASARPFAVVGTLLAVVAAALL